jgi:hypothetical protein
MLDLTRVEGFNWDAGNNRKSAEKHGVTQAEAEQVFFCEQLLVLTDDGTAWLSCDIMRWAARMTAGTSTSPSHCAARGG